MIYTAGLREAMDNFLYGGGIQTQEYPTCERCGEDVGDDGIKTEAGWYCADCLNSRRRYLYSRIAETMGRYNSPLDMAVMRKALEDFEEEYIDE